MKALLIALSLTLTVNAKISLEGIYDEIQLGEQKVSIAKAEVIINKMPGIGGSKPYIIVSLKSKDKKKIREEYKVEGISFPGCTRRFSSAKVEKVGDSYVVRNLPGWAGKGVLVVLTLKDSKGKVHQLKTNAVEQTVF